MNKNLLLNITIGLFLLNLPGLTWAQTLSNDSLISVSTKAKPSLNKENSLAGTIWYGQGKNSEDVYLFELRFKSKGRIVYILSEYDSKDKVFYGTYTQTGNSFVVSLSGKSQWKIQGTIEGKNLNCRGMLKNSTNEYLLEKSREKNHNKLDSVG